MVFRLLLHITDCVFAFYATDTMCREAYRLQAAFGAFDRKRRLTKHRSLLIQRQEMC
jgi:hypothetical protein